MEATSRRISKRRRQMIIGTTLLITAAAIFIYVQHVHKKREFSSPTYQFVQTHMTNTNGTLATYLKDAESVDPDLVAGREALSESLGIWMQIAVLNQDPQAFEQSYTSLRDTFMAPENYVYWKLRPDGVSEVNTNALGDDFRIIRALLDAYDLWQNGEYLNTARALAQTLRNSVTSPSGDYFVDYHDFKHNASSNLFSLVYADTSAFQGMESHGILDPEFLQKQKEVLGNMPNDGLFYPKTFDSSTESYNYDDEVNLIDQLIVAIHLEGLGKSKSSDPLVGFMKGELERKGRLYGRYNRITHEPSVNYDSPAVYGLAIQLALERDDRHWAGRLKTKMLALRNQDPDFQGGYVFDGNSHLFDNLIPLYAEILLYNDKKNFH